MASKQALGRVYHENHPDLASKWNLASADLAVTAHERGDFNQSARLVDAMGRDDRIIAVNNTRIQALLGLDFCMEPAEPVQLPPANDAGDEEDDDQVEPKPKRTTLSDKAEPTPEAKRAAQELERTFFKYAPEGVQREALKWRLMMGFAIAEVIWRDANGKLCDEPQRIKVWHLQHCRWDQWKECFVLNTADAGEVEVRHGDGKWIIFGNGQRPWMDGAVRSLWLLWIGRQFGWRDLFVFGERTGQGIIKAKVPAPLVEGERNRLVSSLRAVWRGIIAELPQGPEREGLSHDLEMLETGADEKLFESMLGRVDLCIAVRMLGQNLTTEVSGDGARSATSAHDRIRIDYLKADTEQHSTDWRGGVLEVLAERKYGDRELAPHPKWDADPPEDEKATAEGQKAAGEAIAAWEGAGYEVENIDEVAQRHGLKVKKKPEPVVDPNAPAAVPGAPGAPPAGGAGGGGKPGKPPAPGKAPAPAVPVKPAAVPARPLAAALFAADDEDPGFYQGQEYVDNLVRSSTARASEALAVDIANILRIVQAAESPEALRAGLAAFYSDATPSELEYVLERARMMAELAGRYSVIETVVGVPQ